MTEFSAQSRAAERGAAPARDARAPSRHQRAVAGLGRGWVVARRAGPDGQRRSLAAGVTATITRGGLGRVLRPIWCRACIAQENERDAREGALDIGVTVAPARDRPPVARSTSPFDFGVVEKIMHPERQMETH
jgi:hypothetical protein